MKSFKKSSLVTLSIILLALIVVYGALYFYIGILRQKSLDLNEKIAIEDRARDQENSLKLLAKDVQPDLEQFSKYIIPADGDISFIKDLETLATNQGVSLAIASANETALEGQDDFKMVTFQISVSGGWRQVLAYISFLESMPTKVVIKQVSMTFLDTTGIQAGNHKWRAEITFSTIKVK